MNHHYCTYFDSNFLASGLTLLDSISKYDPDFQIFVLSLDKKTTCSLRKRNSKNCHIIELQKLEESIPDLLTAKANRNRTEYYWTLTPCILHYIIFILKLSKSLTYLDADQIFFSNPDRIFKEIKNSDITIMPHRFPKHLEKLKEHGQFNVSWLTFNRSENSRLCLNWWMKSCLNWCYNRVEGDKYGDQKYLDQFPHMFNNVHIIENESCGIAPWNYEEYKFNYKIILFHYQSLRCLNRFMYKMCFPSLNHSSLKKLKPYISKTIENLNKYNFYFSMEHSDKSKNISTDTILIISLFNSIFLIRKTILKKLVLFLQRSIIYENPCYRFLRSNWF